SHGVRVDAVAGLEDDLVTWPHRAEAQPVGVVGRYPDVTRLTRLGSRRVVAGADAQDGARHSLADGGGVAQSRDLEDEGNGPGARRRHPCGWLRDGNGGDRDAVRFG